MKRFLHFASLIIFILFVPHLSFAQQEERAIPAWNIFDGQWLPDMDDSLIGSRNFKTLQNFRYTNGGIEGVNGYAAVNTTAVTRFPVFVNGFHFKKGNPQESHVLVEAETSGATSRAVYRLDGQVPNQGEFTGIVPLYEAGSRTGVSITEIGRFSDSPDNTVAYANGKESMIWGGDETRIAAFYTVTSSVTNELTGEKDYTEAVNNKLSDAANIVPITSAGGGGTSMKLLLHCNGADGGTTFTDSNSGATAGAHSIARTGTATTSISAQKFGTASCRFGGGSGTSIYAADSVDWHMENGDGSGTTVFTIDFFVKRITDLNYSPFFQQYESPDKYVRFGYDSVDNIYKFEIQDTVAGVSVAGSGPGNYTASWQHLAVINGLSGGTAFNIYRDGVNLDGFAGADTYPDINAAFAIGGGQSALSGASVTMDGYIDEFHISKGEASGTVPSSEYVPGNTNSSGYWILGATRTISGASIYLANANTLSGQTVEVSEWSGATWELLNSGLTEATQGLTKSGKITWSSTVDTSEPKFMNGKLLYWYKFRLTDLVAPTIYHMTVDTPFQPVTDLWDGVNRSAIGFHASRSGNYEDYTAEISSPSSTLYPIGAEIGGLTSSDYVIIVFEERTQAIKFDMLSGNTSAISAGVSVYYWDGDSYESVNSQSDLTSEGGAPLAKSGTIAWQPPSAYEEFTQSVFGVEGYAYKLVWNGTLSSTGGNTGTNIDTVYGVPAPIIVKPFKFPVMFRNRLLLVGYLEGNEGNRIDYSEVNAPNVFNGEESSMDGAQSLYIDGGENITGAASIFNRYGNSLITALTVFKDNELYVVTGDGPDNWAILRISTTIGCPDPCLSLASAEVGFETVKGQIKRNLLMWVSRTGPYTFDGSIPAPILGISKYFDPAEGYNVDFSTIRGWFDADYQEYNVLIPSIPLWVVYDTVRRKWYEKTTGIASFPQSGWAVHDTSGNQYIYSGTTTGTLVRQEYSNNWGGVSGVTYVWETGDFFPAENNPWVKTRLERTKLVHKRTTENGSLYLKHYADGATSGASLWAIDTSTGSLPVAKTTRAINQLGWSHRLRGEVTLSATTKFTPLGEGYKYWVERDDDI